MSREQRGIIRVEWSDDKTFKATPEASPLASLQT